MAGERAVPGPPGPGSVAWRYVGDWRLLLGVGRALLLQVAHPVVGAGVSEHSDFRADPWGRFDRTLQSLMTQVYGGAGALDESSRLRELHRPFSGLDHRGRPYRALDPEAYWWVHATIFDTVIANHARFGRPLSPGDQVRFYGEWRSLGRLLGIPASRMPDDVAGFRHYFDAMLADRLEDNPAVRDLLETLIGAGTPPPPPRWPLPTRAWQPVAALAGRSLLWVTVGLLPPLLRHRLGLTWDRADERRLGVIAALVRTTVPAVPVRWRYHPRAAGALRAAVASRT